MSGTYDENSIVPVVERWVREKERNLLTLMLQRRELDEEIARERAALADAVPFARTLGIEVDAQTQLTHNVPRSVIARRNARSLPRRAEFEAASLAHAIDTIFSEHPNTDLHANYFVERIFDVQSPTQTRSAKSSIVPVLSNGVRDGKWERVAPNTFRRPMREGEPAVVSDRAPP